MLQIFWGLSVVDYCKLIVDLVAVVVVVEACFDTGIGIVAVGIVAVVATIALAVDKVVVPKKAIAAVAVAAAAIVVVGHYTGPNFEMQVVHCSIVVYQVAAVAAAVFER